MNVLKTVLSIGAILASSSFAMQAQAHCLDTQSITTNSTSAFQQDVYMFTCPTGTAKVGGAISLKSGTGVSYQIGKGGYTAASVSDSTALSTTACTADAGGHEFIAAATNGPVSLPTTVNGGPGVYTLVVSKDTATASAYAMEFHCLNASNVELIGTTSSTTAWQQGGPNGIDTAGLTDALDAVSGSAVLSNDTNHDVNIVINH